MKEVFRDTGARYQFGRMRRIGRRDVVVQGPVYEMDVQTPTTLELDDLPPWVASVPDPSMGETRVTRAYFGFPVPFMYFERRIYILSGASTVVIGHPVANGKTIPSAADLQAGLVNLLSWTAIAGSLAFVWKSARRQSRSKRKLCIHCGYPLVSTGGSVCPECGMRAQPAQSRARAVSERIGEDGV
jgi:hypothetical protein